MSVNRWNSAIKWDSSYTWEGGDLEEFTYEPTYIFTETLGMLTNVLLMDSGKEVRYSKGSPRREFSLTFSNTDDTYKDGITTFFTNNEGRNDTFYWTNPNDSVVYEVRFKSDSLDIDYIDYGIYNIRLTLVEII